jgi:hypothetical protein
MHDLLAKKTKRMGRTLSPPGKELLFGDLIDAAIADPSVHIVGDFVDENDGFYWDITEPDSKATT